MTQAIGIDVSFWQDDKSTPQRVDFSRAYAAGARFAYIKVSQATWLDSDYAYNWDAARRAGLLIGGYHYLVWNVPVLDQARFFAGALRRDSGALPPVLDYECRVGVPLRDATVRAAKLFITEVEQILGRRVAIYTSPDYWKNYGASSDSFFAARPLWIAHYGVKTPTVPAPWSTWEFWQFSDRAHGPTYGAESKQVDINFFNGTVEQFYAKYGRPSIDPPRVLAKYRVRVDSLNVRSQPSTNAPVVKVLRRGEVVEAYAYDTPELWAQTPYGWIAVRYRHQQLAEEMEVA